MALSVTEFAAKIKTKYPDYASIPDEDLVNKLVEKHPDYAPMVDLPKKEGLSQIPSDLENRSEQLQNTWESKQSLPSKLWQTAGAVGGVVGDVANRAMQTAGPIVEKGLEANASAQRDVTRPETATPENDRLVTKAKEAVGKVVAPAVEDVQKTWPTFQKDNPELAKNLEAGKDILTGMTAGKIGGTELAENAVSKGVDVAKAAGKAVEEAVTPAGLDRVIKTGMQKGVKPTNKAGKFSNLTNTEQYYKKSGDAVKTIAEHRDQLNIVDAKDQPVAIPKTTGEFAQAIDQTKKIIYDKYHNLAVTAGQKGAEFDIALVTSELQKIAGPEGPLPKGHPAAAHDSDIRAYARQQIAKLQDLQGASPDVIESRIKDLNQSIPDYAAGTAGKVKVAVDVSVAKALRKQLDKTIEDHLEGAGYQDLKNQYGALRSIEDDVNHRALLQARKNTRGLSDLTDVFTGKELLYGIATGNPHALIRGAAGMGIKELHKHINNPERYIEAMFKRAYAEVPAKVAEEAVPNELAGTAVPTYFRKGVNPEAANAAALAKRDADAQAAAEAQRIKETAVPDAIRNLRPQVTPDQEQRTAMRRLLGGQQ